MIMMKLLKPIISSVLFLFLAQGFIWSAPPIINYAGQVSVNESPFTGSGLFKFAMVHGSVNSVTTVWSNDGTSSSGSEPNGHVAVQVNGGLYSILLGNQAINGMAPINPDIFSSHNDLVLRVWFNDGTNGFQQLTPDRPLASVPYALSAEHANIPNGAISLNMLDSGLRSTLQPEQTTTISDDLNLTNQDTVFAALDTNSTISINLPPAQQNDGRQIRIVPSKSPIKLNFNSSDNTDSDWALAQSTVELISNQGRWTHLGTPPHYGINGMLKDIKPGGSASSSSPVYLTSYQGLVFFRASNGVYGNELWVSNGTTEGTNMLKDINADGSSNPSHFKEVNGTLFFSANDHTHGYELWKTNGTANGTVMVKDINASSNHSKPYPLGVINNELFFRADENTHGLELWKTDGTSNGTTLVKDIRPGILGSDPLYGLEFNGTIYFRANDGTHGVELWKTDGTANGTVMVKDINPGTDNSSPIDFVEYNNEVYFRAHDGIHGSELWKTDGTANGTTMVKDIRAGVNSSDPRRMIVLNQKIFFQATTNEHGRELWMSDGTANGTVLVKDIRPGYVSSIPSSSMFKANGHLFFKANDGIHGNELWKTDGTTHGTRLCKDIFLGKENSDPGYYAENNGSLYFRANDGIHGQELWKFDFSEL